MITQNSPIPIDNITIINSNIINGDSQEVFLLLTKQSLKIRQQKGTTIRCSAYISYGADDEIRTRDPRLGKPMLYR